MNYCNDSGNMKLHLATTGDIPLLASHHRRMFEEIWEQKGLVLEAANAKEVENAYIEKLKKEIPAGTCKAWVVQENDQAVASGAISIVSYVPVPSDVNHSAAYLHSMYTEKEFRGKKYARQIIAGALEFCKKNRISRVVLNASDAGRPLYEKLGFTSSPETMRMFIQ